MLNESELQEAAFEYVVGTLPADERAEFEAHMARTPKLAQIVQQWEEKLVGLTYEVKPVSPDPNTLRKIKARIAPEIQGVNKPNLLDRILPWKWATSVAFALFLVVSMVHFSGIQNPTKPNADYLAVLLDQTEQPVLTALTATEGSTLWLKWEKWSAPENRSLQLWAKSRRDGEIRPLLVFGQQQLNEITLDEATLRLIQDSSHLIITEEEVGGSAFDEPSDVVIATGVCIRLKETQGKV